MSAQSINKVTAFLCKIEAAIVQFELIDLSHSPQTHIILHQELFSTTEFYCFGDCLLRFFESISETYPRPLYGLVAVSGVPVDNVVDIPDSEWPEIEGDQLASDFGMIQLRLINSFAAVGRDIYNLPSAYMTRIQDGEESAEGTGIVIGCSEFLSECILRSTRNSDGTPSKQVFPTLGGLKKFSPISETEWAYEQYIM